MGNSESTSVADLALQIRAGRKKFIAMAFTYGLGALNDNFFKQAIMMIAIGAAVSQYQGYATMIFTLPFILFSAHGGWLADRYPKHRIILGVKLLELVAMLIGAVGIYLASWPLMFVMLFVMGLQSALFNPALNGSIPELYPASFVTKANARVRVAVNGAILIGIAAAGYAVSTPTTGDASTSITPPETVYLEGVQPNATADTDTAVVPATGKTSTTTVQEVSQRARLIVAITIVVIALIGVGVSLGVPHFPARDSSVPFPWRGPLDTLNTLWQYRTDRLLMVAFFGNAGFWFLAALLLQLINSFGRSQLQLSSMDTAYMPIALLCGVAVGGLAAGQMATGQRWHRVLVPSGVGMAVAMLAIGFAPSVAGSWTVPAVFGLLVILGVAGGLFSVPLESFIQVRPAESERGRAIGASNFSVFSGIALSGVLFSFLIQFAPSSGFIIAGILTVIATILLGQFLPDDKRHTPRYLDRFLYSIIRALLRLRYRIRISGMAAIQEKSAREGTGVLILPNHPAYIDPIILISHFYLPLQPRPLADSTQIDRPFIGWMAKRLRVFPIPDVTKVGAGGREAIQDALGGVVDALKAGENLQLYPAGRVYRQRLEDLGANSAVEMILTAVPDARVVLVRTRGLWGSGTSWSAGTAPDLLKFTLRGIGAVLASFFFFVPKREVTIELVEPADLPRNTDRLTLNRYLEAFYNEDARFNTYVPKTIWEGGSARQVPEPEAESVQGDLRAVDDNVREAVTAKLTDLTGKTTITEDLRLAHELGLDSLSRADLGLWIEQEFGHALSDPDALKTVADVMIAGSGQVMDTGPKTLKPIPDAWFAKTSAAKKNARLRVPKGKTLTSVILAQAAKHPDRIIIADQTSGAKTYRDLITAIFVLQPEIEKLSGERIGIMLPASVGATITYIATLFAGKTPVMLNWTAGARNLEHALKTADVEHVLTAKALVVRVEAGGASLAAIASSFVFLEDIGARISTATKALAWLKAKLKIHGSLARVKCPKIAAVLFTSGSESLPKAVPLTHENLLTNIRDSAGVLVLRENDRLLGMLPPFHSFGLTGTLLLPLCLNLPTVFHANPTEGAVLGRLVDGYQASIIFGTPTFMMGIVRASSAAQLGTLRLAFSGAEKCPDTTYAALGKICPKLIVLEGYGITECSPVVSVNREKNPRPGTIGAPLPSVECAIVSPETNQPVDPGTQGMLLVRGASIFGGYLKYDGESPFVTFSGHSWYKTGDLVKQDGDGVLTFCGRLKRFIKIAGEMISLPAIESVLDAAFLHADADGEAADGPVLAVEAGGDEDAPEVVLFSVNELTREQVNAAIREAGLSGLHNVKRIIHVDEIPILGTGKTDYRALKEQL